MVSVRFVLLLVARVFCQIGASNSRNISRLSTNTALHVLEFVLSFSVTWSVSQEILPLGNTATVATFPRIYSRSISTRLPNFLGDLEAIRKCCRSPTRGQSTEMSVLYFHRGIPAKMDLKQYKTLLVSWEVFYGHDKSGEGFFA